MPALLTALWVQVDERFARERGAGLVEYALLIGLIAIVCFAAVTVLGEATSAPFSEFGSQLGS